MPSQELKDFFLRDHFISRSSLLELAWGVIVVTGLMTVFGALIDDIVIPILHLISVIPHLSWIGLPGIGLGHFLATLFVFLFRVASFYFLVVLPLTLFAHRASSEE